MKKKIEKGLVLIEIILMGVLIILITQDYNEIWKSAWKVMVFLGFCYFSYLFVRIHRTENKLITLYQERDKKINDIEGRPVSMPVIDGMIRREELNYQGEISALERQRKYDLEKIPFLRN